MQGTVVLVTGATSGIGEVTARELGRMGATVVIHGRNQAKGEATLANLRAAVPGGTFDLLLADFAALGQVRRMAAEFLERYPRLDVLVNNAGLYLASRQVSEDGYEMTFAVNHLAPFLLTNLLLERIIASAPARIVNVSSVAHNFARMNFADLQAERGYNSLQAYNQSKLANIMFTYSLAERLKGSGVTANCLHPGGVASNFAGNNGGWFGLMLKLSRPFLISAEQGAQTSIHLASAESVASISGQYFVNKQPTRSSRASYNRDDWQQLWQISEQLVGLEVGAALEN